MEVIINLNPFAYAEIAAGYETWYQTTGRRSAKQEKALLRRLLTNFPAARTILEVGCGTGYFTRWFGEIGMRALGLDLSWTMLEQARRHGKLALLQGDALILPFPSGSVDLVALITTLEFLADPLDALAEALRVARQGLILGVLNANSCLAVQYKRRGGPIWETARFFTPAELKHMIRQVAGVNVRIVWRTTLWSFWSGALPLPWGGFIGMSVKI